MTVLQFPRLRRADAIHAAAEWAVASVPAHLSARGLKVPLLAALLLPAIALLPLLSPWASVLLAPVFALAAGLRLAALVGLFLPKQPAPPPLADADLPTVTVLVPLFREASIFPDLAAALARLDYPAHLHRMSAVLTLQGAVAHCDMPLESGPTMLLPYSQRFAAGYVAFYRPEFLDFFAEHHVQTPLRKGDAVFFNPALYHGAGANTSGDIRRMANLLQVSSPFGRAMESLDRTAMVRAVYPALRAMRSAGRPAHEVLNAVVATAEGYPFPTNLDHDQPIGSLAPPSQVDVVLDALDADLDVAELDAALSAQDERRIP